MNLGMTGDTIDGPTFLAMAILSLYASLVNTIAAGISIKDGSGSYNGERALEGRVTNLIYFRGGFEKTEGARAGVSRARSILNLSIDRIYQQITLTPSRLF